MSDLTDVTNSTDTRILKSDQLFKSRIKAQEIFQEHLKQIITVSSASLVLTVAFIKDIVGGATGELSFSWLMPVAWLALGVSIFLSVITIAVMVNSLDKADTSIGHGDYPNAFAAGASTPIVVFVLLSISTFGIGMLALGGFGAGNYEVFLTKGASGYKVLSATQAVEKAKKELSSDISFVHEEKSELINGSGTFSDNLLVWHIQLRVKQNSGPTKKDLILKKVDYYIDSFTGHILKAP